jgi:hypothetical protein
VAELRRCTRCKVRKPREGFYGQAGRKSGLSSWCRECFAEDRLERMTEDKRDHKRRYQRALDRSYQELREECPEAFERLFAQNLAKQGLTHLAERHIG